MTTLLWWWLLSVAILLLLVIRRGRRGGPLVLAYFLGLSLIHVPGAWIYTGADNGLVYRAETEAGFRATLIGLFAFVGGAGLASLIRGKRGVRVNHIPPHEYGWLSNIMLKIGFGTYLLIGPLLSFIPSVTALMSPLGGLLLIGFWFWFYAARVCRDRRRFWTGLVMLPLLPVSTMVTGGFIGFGVYSLICVVAFIYCIFPLKRWFVLLSPVVIYFALSFAAAYFMERGALRDAVWYQGADMEGRLGVVANMYERFEWLDLDNPDHVLTIDQRLNQNILVGQAINLREQGWTEPARGATVPLWIFIPRIVWPDKPAVGGSGSVVADYTGQTFAEGTSVGIGQPLEFYINFGESGIVVGFILLGYALMRFDIGLLRAFRRGDVDGVLRYGLLGIALLQPGGSLMEMLVAVVGALVVTPLVIFGLKKSRWLKRRAAKRTQPVVTVAQRGNP